MLNLVESFVIGASIANPLLAQTTTYEEPSAAVVVLYLIFFIVIYVVASFLVQKIFEKCRVDNAWFAWVPILNTYKTFEAGDSDNPVLWTILMFVPCVNIVAAVMQLIAWVKICQKLGKSAWLLLLWLIPLGAFVFFGLLAYA